MTLHGGLNSTGQRYTKIPASEFGSGEIEKFARSGAGRRRIRIDDHLSHHLRMERALVIERAGIIECERKALARIERARFFGKAAHGVWSHAGVGPCHGCSGRDSEIRLREREIED